MSKVSFSPDKKQLISFFFIFLRISSDLFKQSDNISSLFSSTPKLYRSFMSLISDCEFLNDKDIFSNNFFSLSSFFTLFLSFQKSSFDTARFIFSSFEDIFSFSKIPPNII
mgnify:CR=1 FL=1